MCSYMCIYIYSVYIHVYIQTLCDFLYFNGVLLTKYMADRKKNTQWACLQHCIFLTEWNIRRTLRVALQCMSNTHLCFGWTVFYVSRTALLRIMQRPPFYNWPILIHTPWGNKWDLLSLGAHVQRELIRSSLFVCVSVCLYVCKGLFTLAHSMRINPD